MLQPSENPCMQASRYFQPPTPSHYRIGIKPKAINLLTQKPVSCVFILELPYGSIIPKQCFLGKAQVYRLAEDVALLNLPKASRDRLGSPVGMRSTREGDDRSGRKYLGACSQGFSHAHSIRATAPSSARGFNGFLWLFFNLVEDFYKDVRLDVERSDPHKNRSKKRRTGAHFCKDVGSGF